MRVARLALSASHQRRSGVLGDDERLELFAHLRVRHADAGHVEHRRVIHPRDNIYAPTLQKGDRPVVEPRHIRRGKPETCDPEPGDCVLLYTDGITEAFSPPPDKQMFGTDRLHGALETCTGEPECVIVSIHEKLYDHTRSRSRADDQTLVAMRVDANGSC